METLNILQEDRFKFMVICPSVILKNEKCFRQKL